MNEEVKKQYETSIQFEKMHIVKHVSNRDPLALYGHSHLGSRISIFFRWLPLNSILQPLGWFPWQNFATKAWPQIYLEPVYVLCFGAETLQNKVFSNQNQGHLGSRYIYRVYKQIPLIYHF